MKTMRRRETSLGEEAMLEAECSGTFLSGRGIRREKGSGRRQ